MLAVPRPPFRLCLLLTRALCLRPPLEVVRTAVAGGVDCVQLREKETSTAERLAWGRELLPVCREAGALLIVNDDVEVAAALDADGVHVGQDDLPVSDVRRLLPDGKLIGLSTHDVGQLEDAADLGVDYAGYGPVFATGTKGYTQGLGPESLLQALLVARVPLCAIGGITPANCGALPETVALAVSSALCAADEPDAVAAALLARGARG